MPITLNHSNISVQYSSDKSYIIETVKSDLYLRNEIVETIARDNIQVAPVTPTTYVDSGNVYAVESYTYSGSANTADFTRVFTKSTTCDILVVGGGGSGDRSVGGGGGGGAVLYATNITIPVGSYTLKVGKGGENGNGGNSEAFGATCLGGGSTDYVAWAAANNGKAGGSGSGASAGNSTATGGTVGTSTKGALLNSGTLYNGNAGGNALAQVTGTWQAGGGGGGGAGTAGLNSTQTLYNTRSSWIAGGRPSSGGNGVQINITGTSYYWGAGGGGAGHYGSHAGDGGLGGGGGGGGSSNGATIAGLAGTDGLNSGENGINTGTQKGGNGAPNTGSGGGGGANSDSGTYNGGNGGSGIVIIRYLLGTIPATNYLTNEPVVIAPAFTETIQMFQHSGGTEAQTTHTITIGQNTICDILIVGGGGGGDREIGGGGGGGAVLYATNITIPAGSYTLKVGKGGENSNGGNSEAFGAICLGGGSTDYVAWSTANNGKAGGSGSGGSTGSTTSTGGAVGTSTKGTLLNSGTLYNGNVGGNALPQAPDYNGGAGGGGGAGTAGLNSTQTKYTTRSSWLAAGRPSSGGDGVPINITGTTYYWGAGGGGSGHYDAHPGDGGLGGGGGGGGYFVSVGLSGLAGASGLNSGSNGLITGTRKGGNGGAGTGSGGGGGGYYDGNQAYNGGNGGSGIVIIKFKSIVGAGIPEGNPITHKTLNFLYNNDNLVAWYRFNGDYLDNSGYGNHLTNVGTVIQSTQVIEGQAVEFDNTDYLEFPATINPYTIWNGKGITFSCWIRYTATLENWTTLINFQTDVSNNTGIGCWIRTTPVSPVVAIYLRINSTIFQYGDANTPLIANLNVWRHFVLSVDISGKIDVYIDNVRINGTETATIPNLTYNARYINRSGQPGTWDGQMDDFRIYDRALSAADVSLLYNKTYQQPNNTYTVNFPVPTLADINNNSNIVLRGAYEIALSTTNSAIIPKTGQHIPRPTTFTNYAVERMYPPVRNFTAATTTVSGQTYGNGTYVVTFSSTYGDIYDPWTCFNTSVTSGGHWAINRYTAGVFNNTSFIVSGYLGDWVKIQLPVAIKLSRFSFLQRTGFLNRSPKDFKIYGSNDNITWIELVNKTDVVYNASYIYEQSTPEITNTYSYYGLVVNKIVGSDTILNFDEWYIYGQEASTSSLSLRYHLLNPILDPIGAQWTYSSNNTNVYHMGSVGIGTTSPEYQLDVRGAIYSSIGGITQTGLTSWSITSDRRIKDNITRASYDICLENVKNIELYNFNFKNNCVNTNDKHQLGFIAQEVQQVYPKAVEVGKMILNTNEAIDDILTLNTTQIDYTLYGAVKNLIEKIEDIDNDLENIEKAAGMGEPLGEPAPNAGN